MEALMYYDGMDGAVEYVPVTFDYASMVYIFWLNT
jgi:hypothetical protein